MRLARVLAPMAILGLVALVFGQVVAAASFPEKPVTYMICFDPGGESDITARLQQKYLEDVLKTKVVITYKVGGGGAVGWSELIRSKPDGYTIAGDNLPHTILQPMQRGDAGYTTEQLKRVYCFESTPCALVVKKDSPLKTLADFIAFAKKNPGAVTLGGSGSWTANHLGTIELEKAVEVKLTYIPFTGSGSATPALLGGHVTGLMTYTTTAAQQRSSPKCAVESILVERVNAQVTWEDRVWVRPCCSILLRLGRGQSSYYACRLPLGLRRRGRQLPAWRVMYGASGCPLRCGRQRLSLARLA